MGRPQPATLQSRMTARPRARAANPLSPKANPRSREKFEMTLRHLKLPEYQTGIPLGFKLWAVFATILGLSGFAAIVFVVQHFLRKFW